MTVAEFLAAVNAGAERSDLLARELATRVLDELGGRIALQVLEGGPLTIAHALRLASVVLEVDGTATARRVDGAS